MSKAYALRWPWFSYFLLGYKRFACTLTYIFLIVAVNTLFVYAPYLTINHSLVSSADAVVGAIYLLRDFAQREIKHYIIIAMLIGCFLSYILADKQVAVASISAFFVGESIDWGIYTFTKKSLSQRLLWSASISAPVDSAIFLVLSNTFNNTALLVMTLAKFSGVFCVWFSWHFRTHRNES